jgi:hypothetical protein
MAILGAKTEKSLEQRNHRDSDGGQKNYGETAQI